MIVHADDYGITAEQSAALLALSSRCGGNGALQSVSIFANSPIFDEAAHMARPFVDNGRLTMALHINLVEGRPCSPAHSIPLLVDERGMFSNNFVGLMTIAASSKRNELRRQIEAECTRQLTRYLSAFPLLSEHLRIDSHQHTHAVPLVYDAVLSAVEQSGARLEHLRIPCENLSAFRTCGRMGDITPTNRVKRKLLAILSKRMRSKLPESCSYSAFAGVALSGHMDLMDARLANALDADAQARGLDLEMLFHPISVEKTRCLDPENKSFASACASIERDKEAAVVQALETKIG